ncbi:MAG: SCO family protein [Cumulibacter sp.]|uniref:SCO family protein n=1 Tax=Cumulibacter soli TaxID=2546344 RepID=UPI00106743FD|nr:SCO family protein [Cumulibacter soli]
MYRRIRTVAALLAAALVALTGCSAAEDSGGGVADVTAVNDNSAYRGIEMQPEPPRPEFTLTDQNGDTYDFGAQTADTPTILYFGYTHCPDVCPLIMGQVSSALSQAPDEIKSELQVVFVTTDPATDKPAVLGDYLAKFDADLPVKYIGLTGSLDEVEAAQEAAGVPVAEDGGKTHSTMAIYYGSANKSHVAWLANTSAEDILHDLPIGVK